MRETGSRPVTFCQNRAQWILHTGLLPDRIHLATTWHGHQEPNRTVWSGPFVEKRHRIRSWETGSGPVVFNGTGKDDCVLPEPGPMILAHQLASGPDPFGHNPTWPSRTKLDPGLFRTIWSRPSVEEQNQIECGKQEAAFCQNRAQWILLIGLLPYWIHLATTWHGHQEPNRTVWFRLFVEKQNRIGCRETGSGLVAFWRNQDRWFLYTGLLPEQIRLDTMWHGHPEPNQIQAGVTQYDPVSHNMIFFKFIFYITFDVSSFFSNYHPINYWQSNGVKWHFF